MTRGAWGRRSVAAGGWLVIYFILCTASSQAGTTTIYKCLDNNLGLVYTDEPCKEGERLELRPGEADPEAVTRLDRVRDALDREALGRATDARRAIIGNEGTLEFASGGETGAYDYGPAYVSSGGILAYSPSHRHPMRQRRVRFKQLRQVAPRPPEAAPRR